MNQRDKLDSIEKGINHLIAEGLVEPIGPVIVLQEESIGGKVVLLTGPMAVDRIQRNAQITRAVLEALNLPETAGVEAVVACLAPLFEPVSWEHEEGEVYWYRCIQCGATRSQPNHAKAISCLSCKEGWCEQIDPPEGPMSIPIEPKLVDDGPARDAPALNEDSYHWAASKSECTWLRCPSCGISIKVVKRHVDDDEDPTCCTRCGTIMVSQS